MQKCAVVLFSFFNLLIVSGQPNLTQGLVAYYPFNGNTLDATGLNYKGIVIGGAQLTTDRNGVPNSAYHFDGLTGYIQIPNNPILNSSNALSIALYFNPEQTTVQTLIGKIGFSTGIGTQYQLAIDFSLFPGALFGVNPIANGCGSPALNASYANTGGNISNNQWYCLVGTFDNGVQKIYLNGALIQTNNAGFNTLNQCSNADIQIGAWWNGDLQYFRGKIDDIRIYNRAINQQEVSALCQTILSPALCQGSLGDPIVNISFGSGDNPGQPLSNIVPGASTNLAYVAVTGNPANPTPQDGQYTITNNVPFNADWFSGAPDHTPNVANGYMAFYNSSVQPGEFYRQTVNNLCGSTTYEFAAWIANALNPAAYIGVNPDITFIIEQADGTLLASYDKGPVTQNASFTWVQYGFSFTTPISIGTVVLRMINNSPGGTANFGNDFAIDDITFRPCGPSTIASFAPNTLVDSIAVCEGADTTLFGTISSGYNNPIYGWEISSDNGNTWAVVPNSNSLQLKVITPPATGTATTYKYRIIAGEGTNIYSPNCRIASNLIILTIVPGPTLAITADTSICPGGTIQLQVSGGTSYTWSPSRYLNNPNISNPIASPTTSTLFFVTAEDTHNCAKTDSVKINILPRPKFVSPSDTSVCQGSSVQLDGKNGINYSYSWSPSQYLSNPNISNPISTPTSAIQYALSISDHCNYDSIFLINVSVNPNPVITIQKSNDIDCNTPSAQLTASGGVRYLWSPSSGLIDANKPNPITTVDTSTTFVVQGFGQNGCSSSSSIAVKVTQAGKASFRVPNAFTPNGDGHNDCFGISHWGGITLEEFSIYNRWGEKIFSTKDPSQCWDGTFQGKQQDTGAYPYVIKGKSFCGIIDKKGIVMLIR